MVLLIHPHDKRLGGVVEDTSAIRPVSRHTGGSEEGRDGFVKHQVLFYEAVLLSVSHFRQRKVLPLQEGGGNQYNAMTVTPSYHRNYTLI